MTAKLIGVMLNKARLWITKHCSVWLVPIEEGFNVELGHTNTTTTTANNGNAVRVSNRELQR